MTRPGPRNLITDLPGLLVGNAQDPSVRTGVTLIRPEGARVCAVAVAGGGPGARELDALSPRNLVGQADAIVLAGGSVYGLAAADGVASALGAAGKGFGLIDLPGVPRSPIVPSAILYDLANGGNKAWGQDPPYRRLGLEALAAEGVEFALGAAGAGYGARAGAHPGGLGSVSASCEDGLMVGAIAAVNAFGSVYLPNSDVFWAWPLEQEGEFGGARPEAYALAGEFDLEDWGAAKRNPHPRENTTIALVATNAALTTAEAERVAHMALAGFARAIRPVFAPFDGDIVFALAMGDWAMPNERAFALARIGSLGADCLARAIARGVFEARPV